jgi:proteic killer suppression protein
MVGDPARSAPVIQSFADKPTEALWLGKRPPELPPAILKTALRKLTQLEAAGSLDELRFPPGNRLEALKGNRAGRHSIRINDRFRVCFRWADHNAHDVEITDYHRP